MVAPSASVEIVMKKVALATQMIQKRIAHADHVLVGIPGERQLAEELGLSRTTVRTALQQLMEQGTLIRQGNGRLNVAEPRDGRRRKTIGFVAPAVPSADFEQWSEGVQGALEGHQVTIRPVSYAHWADPAIQEALSGFDGLFFIPPAEKIPSWLAAKMKESACRVVVLDQDETSAGLPSVTLFPPSAEQKLFDHLTSLGHQRIDCLNTQAEDQVIQGRISVWGKYLETHGIAGQLRSLSVRKPIETAYQLIRDALQEGRPVGSALFCTTGPASIGAMRALHEAGLEIGRDVSVCAVNGEGVGRFLLRSLTALESPPRALYLRHASEWMLGDGDWEGPLLIQPADVPLFEGESTGPAPASPIVSLAPSWKTIPASTRVERETLTF
jgi:DNA-binding LacI/PurR family transcriptional regulator